MKKTTFFFMVILIAVSAFFIKEGKINSILFKTVLSKDVKKIVDYSLSFMEDLKFKDFSAASKYHSKKDQKKTNIPKVIEKLFKIKPEFLDIIEYKVLESSLDSTKTRARVKMKTKINILNSGKIKTPEIILYYHKKNERWYMELESSLK